MRLDFELIETFSSELRHRSAPAAERAEHILAIQMAKDTEKYVPALTLSLSNRTRVVVDTIIYPGPYAHYLYRGKLMVDPETGSPYAPHGSTKILTDRNLVFNKTVHSDAQDHWFEASKAQNRQKWIRVAGRVFTREIHR